MTWQFWSSLIALLTSWCRANPTSSKISPFSLSRRTKLTDFANKLHESSQTKLLWLELGLPQRFLGRFTADSKTYWTFLKILVTQMKKKWKSWSTCFWEITSIKASIHWRRFVYWWLSRSSTLIIFGFWEVNMKMHRWIAFADLGKNVQSDSVKTSMNLEAVLMPLMPSLSWCLWQLQFKTGTCV
jgi:hypothetical protein